MGVYVITHRISKSGFEAKEFSQEEREAAIYQAEATLSQFENIMLPAEHMFVPGLYFRRFEMEMDTILTGKLHTQDDGLIVASGKVTFITKDGERVIEGPCMLTVKSMTKPILYAHTHVVFFSAHLNLDDTRDISVIESRVVTPNSIGCKTMEVLS